MPISRDQILSQGTKIVEGKDFGTMFRNRRKELGYTQEEVADMLGFSPRLVGEIERGRGTVGVDKVLRYATAIGVDIIAIKRGSR